MANRNNGLARVYRANAAGLRALHARAVATGKPQRGYTARELDERAARYEQIAAECEAGTRTAPPDVPHVRDLRCNRGAW